MKPSRQQLQEFAETLADFYAHHARRSLPWRQPEPDGRYDPYKIMVSELMLQQTQVPRVIPKYAEFLIRFPDIRSLAEAALGDVLRVWQGLGYNRRAKFLWQAAREVQRAGTFPGDQAGLVALPGIGPNTAGAILAYAFNQPAIFIETNVRTVYIHHFLGGQTGVDDKTIRQLVAQTIDTDEAREFYWALMDYGSYLKATVGNVSVASKHFARQSAFHGSRRQVRGQVIRMLGHEPHTASRLRSIIADDRLDTVLAELTHEQLIQKRGGTYYL